MRSEGKWVNIEALTVGCQQKSVDEIRDMLDANKKTKVPFVTVANFLTVMRNDEKYASIHYNEIATRAEIHGMNNGKIEIRPWEDADEANSRAYIEDTYSMYSTSKHEDALRILFAERKYNPIINIVDDLKWDGTERCHDFLHRWAMVDDNEYTREVSRLIFAGGIHRLYSPGTKFDCVPILIGLKQGEGKSTLIRWLALNDSYYGEINLMEGQQAIEQLQGKWICEISELLALTKTREQEAAKAYITRQSDMYRKPFDRNASELPRRCIAIGSTNVDSFLSDKSGNRRYFPVKVHSDGYDLHDHEEECREYIAQCWAEARDKYRAGTMPNYPDRALIKQYREAQEDAMQDDWRVGAIQNFLESKMPGDLTCIREICHEALSPNKDFPRDPSPIESKDIGLIMNKQPDWEKVGSRKVGDYGKQKAWKKIRTEQAEHEAKDYQNLELPF